MVIFFGSNMKVAIPENRILRIVQVGFRISIFYETGEITFLESDGSAVAPKIDCKEIGYESEELAVETMREYFKACAGREGAFYF